MIWMRRRTDMAAFSVIALSFLLCFGPPILKGKFFLWYDAFIALYPEHVTAWNAIRHGSLPLWTPLVMSGYPLLSMAQIGIAYPLTWGYLFLPGHWAEEIYVLAPYLLAPAFTYFYSREIGRSRAASLLAGLGYGYGGLMVLGFIHNGLLPNATMWTPLLLVAIERSQKAPFFRAWLWATGAYAMSVLTGIGQGFLFVGLLALVYSIFIVVAAPAFRLEPGYRPPESITDTPGWFIWRRWRPLAVTLAAILTSAGLAAFQILETMRAQRLSIRGTLGYDVFAQGSLTFRHLLRSLFSSLYYHGDLVGAYVPLLALVLGIWGAVAFAAKQTRDLRILFWTGVAIVGWLLMLGVNTPVYRALYYLPILRLFRGAARHGYEWTFSVSILAAYGWDLAADRVSRSPKTKFQGRRIAVALALVVAGAVIGWLWWTTVRRVPGPNPSIIVNISEAKFLGWKLLFTVLVLAGAWQSWKIASGRWRTGVMLAAIMLACFIEPFITISRFWWPLAKPSSRFSGSAAPTRFLQQFPAEQNRIYTRVLIEAEENNPHPAFDPQNVTMLAGLENVAGYDPLFPERYSRALGDVWLDGVTTRGGFMPDDKLLESSSHVLDILNNTYLLCYFNPLAAYENRIEKDGIGFAFTADSFELKPGAATQFSAFRTAGDTLALVTTLTNSADIGQGTPVAKIRIFSAEGRMIERELQAGVDTAEWAHERPDVAPVIRHTLAPIFDRQDEGVGGFPQYRYWTRIPLGERLAVDRVEVINLSRAASVVLWKASLYDSSSSFSLALQNMHYDQNKWRPVYNSDNILILRNERALPRVWLTAAAEAIDGEEALRRIRGEGKPFEPLHTALLEIDPDKLTDLPGGRLLPGATARLATYEANRLAIETEADTSSVLVVSEMNYPGWRATLDGRPAPIYAADYLLRGVLLPPGRHRVEMQYAAPAARVGGFISLFTLVLVCGVALAARRRKHSEVARP